MELFLVSSKRKVTGGLPFDCVLAPLGRVRCGDLCSDGAFPQISLEDLPLWRIHNFADSTSETHFIGRIGRPDSIALLEYLGRCDCDKAVGALVVGCDFKSPPTLGESAQLMRIAQIQKESSEETYNAVLVNTSTITVGKVSLDISESNKWPRISVELPRVWTEATSQYQNPPEALIEKSELVPSPPLDLSGATITAATECPIWQKCFNAFKTIIQDSSIQLSDYRNQDMDKCFCTNCHKRRKDKLTYLRGELLILFPWALPVWDLSQSQHLIVRESDIATGMFATMAQSLNILQTY